MVAKTRLNWTVSVKSTIGQDNLTYGTSIGGRSQWFANFLQDNKPRYFVPEVNSSDNDILSIINGLEGMGIKFY